MTKNNSEEDAKERMTLVKNSLISAFSSSKCEESSLFPVLNRMIILLQKPIAISLYEKRGKGENAEYHFFFNSIRDDLYKDNFTRVHKSLHKEENYLKSDNYKLLHKFISSKNNKYHCIIFEVKKENNNVTFEPIEENETNSLSKTYNELIENFELCYDRMNLSDSVENWEKEVIEKISDSEKNYLLCDKDIEEFLYQQYHKEKLNRTYCNNSMFEITNHIYDIIDIEYNIFRDSPILNITNEDTPTIPNLFIWGRFFSEYEKRYEEHYDYNCRWIIPETQKEDIKIALSKLSEQTHRKILPPFKLYKQSDDKFWNLIGSEEGQNTIISIVSSPYHRCARSFVDSIMLSGVTHFKTNPFEGDALGQIIEDSSEEDAVSDEQDRLCYMHYIISLMFPGNFKEQDKASLYIFPSRTNASTSYCFGTVRKQSDIEHSEDYHRMFLQTFHCYHDIFKRLSRRIRLRTYNFYIKAVSDIIMVNIQHAQSICEKEREQINYRDFTDEINKHLSTLSRSLPYDEVSIKISPNLTPSYNTIDIYSKIGKDYYMRIDTSHNKYYSNPRKISNRYNPKKIIKEVRKYFA